MSLTSIPKTVVDRSLKLTRVPLDFALSTAGLKRRTPEARAAERLREQAEAERQRAAGAKREADPLREAAEKAKEARKKVE